MEKGVIIGLMIILVSWFAVAKAQPLLGQRESLAQLPSVRVEVQLIGSVESIGITEHSIVEIVEGRLRESGLEVRDSDDRSVRGDPRLRVALQAVNAAGGYAYFVSVQLVERVISYKKYVELVFDGILPTKPTDSVEPLEIALGIKWEAQALGTTSQENAVNSVPNSLLGYVDRFLEDYRAAGGR